MSGRVLFSERQYFRQPWIVLVFFGVAAVFFWGFVQQIILGDPWGNNPAPDSLLTALFIIFGLAFPVLFLSVNLSVIVEEDRLLIRFFPFHIRYRMFTKAGIATHKAVEYRPLRDYGGRGIRCGMKGKAYNVSGNQGVLFELPDGATLLIGSARAEELDSSMHLMEEFFVRSRIQNTYRARSDWFEKV